MAETAVTIQLDEVEARVLGSLVEKQVTTPDYYPLSLNALTNACNQKSNRSPVVHFDDRTVVRALDALRDKKLVWVVSSTGARTLKYEHSFANILELAPPQVALLCLLMLRGPQTVGELRGRSGRLHAFDSLLDVECILEELCARQPTPLVVKLPRQVGRKEHRYMHLLCGEPELDVEDGEEPQPEKARLAVQSEDEKIAALQAQIDELRAELAALREELTEFQNQFE